MKLRIFTGVIISILFISGCTTDPMTQRTLQVEQSTWKKAGISQDDINSAVQKYRYDIGMANVSSEREKAVC